MRRRDNFAQRFFKIMTGTESACARAQASEPNGQKATNQPPIFQNFEKSLQKCQNEKDSIAQQLPRVSQLMVQISTCDNFLYKMYQENELFPIHKHSTGFKFSSFCFLKFIK